MRIAQIAPLTEAVPPKLYGGTERVVHWLTEELVALGHDVTLFASGDFSTSAKLDATWPKGLRLDGSVRDPNALHMMMLERVRQKCDDEEFDFLHFHLDYYPFSLFSRQPTPFLTTLHGRLDLPELQPVFTTFSSVPVISISTAQRRPVPQAKLGPHNPPRSTGKAADAAIHLAELSRGARSHRAGKRRRPSHQDSHTMRYPPEDRRQGRSRRSGVLRRNHSAAAAPLAGRIYRRDRRSRKIGFSQWCNRPIVADRLAGALRSCDDRGHGVRHARDRVQPRFCR